MKTSMQEFLERGRIYAPHGDKCLVCGNEVIPEKEEHITVLTGPEQSDLRGYYHGRCKVEYDNLKVES